MERKLLQCLSLIFFAVACGRGVDKIGSASSITIRTPNHLVSSGAGTLVALPVGRAACYGINIIGAGPSVQSTCGPTTGIIAGFVAAGESVTAAVPSKSNVNIQLFLYLKASGDTSPCPTFLASIPGSQLANTYLVGESGQVFVDGSEMTVTINGIFPGVSQNIATTMSLPASCVASNTKPNAFGISAGAQTLSNGSFNMTARAGKPMGQILTSGSYNLIVR